MNAGDVAVVGHVEWVDFLRVPNLPRPGRILHALEVLEQPAGGGAVAAVQLAKLAGRALFFTALGRDSLGERAAAELQRLGVELHVAWRDAPTRRAVTFVDGSGERSITVIGPRLTPRAQDPLPWHRLASCRGVFLTAADAPAIRLAREAAVLTATPRVSIAALNAAAVSLDALIGSGRDPGETCVPGALDREPQLTIATAGADGGCCIPGGRFAAAPLPAPCRDTYGAGDSFAAGVTYGLAMGWLPVDAVALGCRCGAACVTATGPYAGQLRLNDGTPEPKKP